MNGLRKCDIYIYIYPIKENEIMFAGKWMDLEIIMLSKAKSGSEGQSLHVFSPIWKIDPKDKCIHKYKHNHIHM
jgi:hypothetical protein